MRGGIGRLGKSWGKLGEAARQLSVHEHQGASVMREAGIAVPAAEACTTSEGVAAAASRLAPSSSNLVALKAQILAGGRGLGHFPSSGLQGGVHLASPSDAPSLASRMLNHRLVTKQTPNSGLPVHTVNVAEPLSIAREMYLAIAIDRASAAPLIIGSAEGGTSIEELAQSAPHKIVRKHVDFDAGLSEDEAREIVDTLGIASSLREHGTQQMLRMYSLFRSKDLTLLEINPFAETTDGRLIAADAKLSFDDNTEFRHPDIFNMRDTTQEDPREVAAREYELNYIGLDGSIGCMVNGAGLAMATMDIIKYYGGNPANFLDVGGSATEDQIVQAFNILTGDQKVDAILVNIFGGIMKCDVIASGIVKSAEKVGLRVPLVVRLEGTNVAEGKRTLSSSTLPIIPADNLDDAAQNVVKTQMK